ncbi:MAG: hypothetical protein ACXV8X_10280, partial [Candidatus Angelobacter sp.]
MVDFEQESRRAFTGRFPANPCQRSCFHPNDLSKNSLFLPPERRFPSQIRDYPRSSADRSAFPDHHHQCKSTAISAIPAIG